MLYLASRSPQRSLLLKRAGISFVVVDSTCDEETVQFPQPQMLALERARAKALGGVVPTELLSAGPAVVLGADTVVALGTEIFGKPRDRADAARILRRLQGTTHTVYTGHCCRRVDAGSTSEAARIAMSRVTMRCMSDADIAAYVASGESDGRAGAYAIQETGDRFVSDIHGDWDTIVGLHVGMTARLYRECTDAWPYGYRP